VWCDSARVCFTSWLSCYSLAATFAAIKPLLGHRFHTAGRNISTLILPHLFSICVHAPEGAGLALAPRVLVEGLMLVIDAAMKVTRRFHASEEAVCLIFPFRWLCWCQELDPDTRVAQVECVKDCMYTCANYPTHLESKPGCSTALPPLALPLEQAEQLIQALVLIARASIMRRVEGMQSLGAKEDADQHGDAGCPFPASLSCLCRDCLPPQTPWQMPKLWMKRWRRRRI
jgi:hypothetical protein